MPDSRDGNFSTVISAQTASSGGKGNAAVANATIPEQPIPLNASDKIASVAELDQSSNTEATPKQPAAGENTKLAITLSMFDNETRQISTGNGKLLPPGAENGSVSSQTIKISSAEEDIVAAGKPALSEQTASAKTILTETQTAIATGTMTESNSQLDEPLRKLAESIPATPANDARLIATNQSTNSPVSIEASDFLAKAGDSETVKLTAETNTKPNIQTITTAQAVTTANDSANRKIATVAASETTAGTITNAVGPTVGKPEKYQASATNKETKTNLSEATATVQRSQVAPSQPTVAQTSAAQVIHQSGKNEARVEFTNIEQATTNTVKKISSLSSAASQSLKNSSSESFETAIASRDIVNSRSQIPSSRMENTAIQSASTNIGQGESHLESSGNSNPITNQNTVLASADLSRSLTTNQLSPLLNQGTTATGNHSFSMQTPVGHSGWSTELGNRIQFLTRAEISTAELQLHPAELGRIDVQISTEDEKTTVMFFSNNSGAKEALEAALPRLRELLANQGLELSHNDVAEGSLAEHRQQQSQQTKPGTSETANPDGIAAESETETTIGNVLSGSSLVDYYI